MMKRNSFFLRRRTTICQKLPVDFEDKLVNFQRYVMQLRRESRYGLGQIGNADKTPVYIDMPRTCTANEVGAQEAKVRTTGYEKQRVTIMPSITADGWKLAPYIILKRKNMLKNETFLKDVIVRVQEKGWMTSELMQDWIRVVWQQRPGASLGGFKSTKSMLMLDALHGHLTPEVKAELDSNNCDLVVVPGGTTSVLQPLDVSVNKPFKENLRQEYEEWIRSPDRKKTPTGKLQKASPSTVVTWISDAWKRVRANVVVKSFRKCCITNRRDGTEDDLLWNTDSSRSSSSGGGTDSSSSSDSESD
ncbi:pogo transposable element with KRAB domain [Ixodes scapularis]